MTQSSCWSVVCDGSHFNAKYETSVSTELFVVHANTQTTVRMVLSKLAIVDNSSPSILVRSRKTPSVTTGLRVVDVLFPVAFGQRELVIGDRQSGKSTV